MSLVVSSTTDSQEAVNAAAGITDAGAATAPAEPAETPAESQPPQPTTPEEPKTEEEEPDEQDDSGEPREPARKKGGFQRKIERLERRNEELEAALVATRKPVEQPPKPPVEQAEPQLDQFADPQEFVRQYTAWQFQQLRAQEAREAAKWHAQEQDRQLTARWNERVDEFAETVSDFDEAVAGARDIMLAGDVVKAIKRSEVGPRLLYELMRQPKEAARIARLDPIDAIREMGKLEARFSSSPDGSEAKPIAPHTKAPPPIRPVGGGGPTTTVPPDQMPYQQYKAWRKKHGAR